MWEVFSEARSPEKGHDGYSDRERGRGRPGAGGLRLALAPASLAADGGIVTRAGPVTTTVSRVTGPNRQTRRRSSEPDAADAVAAVSPAAQRTLSPKPHVKSDSDRDQDGDADRAAGPDNGRECSPT